MGTSPAFPDSDKGIVVWESGAVLTYLLEAYDTSFRFHPVPLSNIEASNAQSRAKLLHIQQYMIATAYPFIASLLIHSLKPKDQQDSEYLENGKEKWLTLLGPTLANWLGDSDFSWAVQHPL